MSTILFKEVGYPLSLLLECIKNGEIGLPDIQRPFVWPNTKVRDLFDSMYKGFPVGYLLFWANGVDNGHRQIGSNPKQKVSRLLIVDGQQRLTSLFAVLTGFPVMRDDYQKERVRIAFCPRTGQFEVADAAISKDPEYIEDISNLWAGEVPRGRFVKGFIATLRASREVSDDEEDQLSEAIDRLFDLQNYPFTALELSTNVSEEQVAEVFVRINSRGTPLNQADFILTLMSVFWDDGRFALERFCRDARHPSTGAPSSYNHFIQPDPDQLLRVEVALGFRRARLQHVYSILRGKDLDTGEFSDTRRVEQFTHLQQAQDYTLDIQNWHDFLKALLRAGYRSSSMIMSNNSLLYSYALHLIGKRDFQVDSHRLRNAIARWFFMAALTSRYTGSFESVMEQDLGRLRDVKDASGFVALLDRVVKDTFTDDYWSITLPNDLATSAPRSPSLYAYYAALNLVGARVLFSKVKVSELLDPATHASKSALERHHLFPKDYLSKLGITERRDVNQIANYALVEWEDNIHISGDPPSKYYPKYKARLSQQDLKQMTYWHGLPHGWEHLDYSAFLDARRSEIAKVIRDGYRELWT